MFFDLGPPPIAFPKPAIIRPATKDLLRYGGNPVAQALMAHRMRRAAGAAGSAALTTLTFVNSAVSNAATITIPADAAAGDLAVLFDYSTHGGATITDVTPTNWSSDPSMMGTQTGGRIRVSYKILVGGDPGSSVTGLNDTNYNKVMFIFRGDVAITSVTIGSWHATVTGTDPVSQSVTASGQATPLVVLGGTGSEGNTAAFTTASPAFDATVATADNNLLGGYKIYNSSPADHTVDSGDLTTNDGLCSGYLIAS